MGGPSKILLLFFVVNTMAETCFKETFCIPDNYDKLSRPMEGLVDIEVEIHVTEVISINDQDFTATMMLYLQASWEEPRIKNNNTDAIPIELSIKDKLWVPDLYIPNMKSFKTEKILTDLAGEYVLRRCEK